MTRKLGAPDISALMRREISKENWKLYDRLPAERKLAETYGVARGTIREALNRLEREGYVETRPGSGTYVIHKQDEPSASAVNQANPLELMDVRFALEPHICRLAILHGRQADFDKLEAFCVKMEGCQNDPSGFSEADTAFHKTLADSTHNRLLAWIIGQINSVRTQEEWTRMRHVTLDEKIIALYNTQHRQIVNALRTREPERAANLMKDHLETARLSLTRAAET